MIGLFGGTSDSIVIGQRLVEKGLNFILSVASDYGKKLASDKINNISAKRMDRDEIVDFIKENKINYLIDATHPYASQVSTNIMDAAKILKIPYIRYERKRLIAYNKITNATIVTSVDEAISLVRSNKEMKRLFLGTGSNAIGDFTCGLSGKTLIVRVIPSKLIIEKCLNAGIKAQNIIAMQGPFSQGMNMETFKHFQVDTLITKESGKEGGFLEKIRASEELGMNIIIIDRPKISYPKMVDNIEDLMDELDKNMKLKGTGK